uniref:Mucin/peritrophin-like protein n=1 Tax=Ornithodoros moubata TaxID=6938 RepID=Q6QZV3_ORNMO|nr:mucin/peritrophin-like protein precursor [Ornithodoros moubata]
MKTAFVVCIITVTSALCKSVQQASSSDCPETNSVSAFNVADPNDCSKYSVCGAYVAIKADCPKGQHFSKTTKKCEDVVTANCDPDAVAAALAAKAEADAKSKPVTVGAAATLEAKPNEKKADEHTPETKAAEKPASALVGKPESQPGAPAAGGPSAGAGGQPSSGPGAKPNLKLSSNPAEKPEGLPEHKVGKPF